MNNLRRLIFELPELIKIFIYYIYTFFPINKNLIVFESNRGLSYSCNPKYIYEELFNYNRNYKCVWSFQNTDSKINGNAIKVKRFSIKYYYYLATAKYWIQNGEFGKKIKRRKGTIYINTQHGTPLKKMGVDIPYLSHKKKMFDKSRKWDYLISPNAYTTQIMRRAYNFSGEVLETGYPRNDLFYQKNNPESILALKKSLGLPLDKRLILYAPTYRDSSIIANPHSRRVGFDFKIDLDLFHEKLSKEYVFILRLHHLIAQEIDTEKYNGFILNFSGANYNIQELLLISDILITDYSSVMFDYANLKRPMLFYTYDIDEYQNDIRGFYLDFPKIAPGPLLSDNVELLHAIMNIDRVKKDFDEKLVKFSNRFCRLEDGNAAKRIIERLF